MRDCVQISPGVETYILKNSLIVFNLNGITRGNLILHLCFLMPVWYVVMFHNHHQGLGMPSDLLRFHYFKINLKLLTPAFSWSVWYSRTFILLYFERIRREYILKIWLYYLYTMLLCLWFLIHYVLKECLHFVYGLIKYNLLMVLAASFRQPQFFSVVALLESIFLTHKAKVIWP